jgi:hypothetical protein
MVGCPLQVPNSCEGIVEENKESGHGSSGTLLAGVVGINIEPNVHLHASWLRGIRRDCFLNWAIEGFPVTFLELGHVDVWVTRVKKDHLQVVLLLQVGV